MRKNIQVWMEFELTNKGSRLELDLCRFLYYYAVNDSSLPILQASGCNVSIFSRHAVKLAP